MNGLHCDCPFGRLRLLSPTFTLNPKYRTTPNRSSPGKPITSVRSSNPIRCCSARVMYFVFPCCVNGTVCVAVGLDSPALCALTMVKKSRTPEPHNTKKNVRKTLLKRTFHPGSGWPGGVCVDWFIGFRIGCWRSPGVGRGSVVPLFAITATKKSAIALEVRFRKSRRLGTPVVSHFRRSISADAQSRPHGRACSLSALQASRGIRGR